MDFAGSGVVHLLGACCSLVGCYFLGPRLHRFSEDGKPNDMAGHSVPLIGLGGFILLFGCSYMLMSDLIRGFIF